MTFVAQLTCRECGRAYEVAPLHVCEWCFGPLEAAYDYDAIRSSVLPALHSTASELFA